MLASALRFAAQGIAATRRPPLPLPSTRGGILAPFAVGLATLGFCALGCAGAPKAPLDAPPAPALAPDALRVRLVFEADVDLDLYVTGPSSETVYYANSPSREGGALDADARCGASSPRVETIEFPAAGPGLYRVGVDFPERCGSGIDQAPYLLLWEAPQRSPAHLRGEASFGRFDVRVVEFPLD